MKLEDYGKVGVLKDRLENLQRARAQVAARGDRLEVIQKALDIARMAALPEEPENDRYLDGTKVGRQFVPSVLSDATARFLSETIDEILAKLGTLGVTVGILLMVLIGSAGATPVVGCSPYAPDCVPEERPEGTLEELIAGYGVSNVNPYLVGNLVGNQTPNPYTACFGSWDGPGMTACEWVGRPGTIGVALSFAGFAPDPTPLMSVTARPPGGLIVESNGSVTYWNDFNRFNSLLDPNQFAYWEDEEGVLVGVEDLVGPSDGDFNDYLVAFHPHPVPEPGLVGLVLLGLGAAIRHGRSRR